MFLEVVKIDWKMKKIPDRLNGLIFLAGLISLLFIDEITIAQRCLGIFIVSFPMLLIAVRFPGSIGGGDIKLMASSGILLGANYIWRAFTVGIILAGIYVVAALITKKVDRKTEIALGPFLCIGIIYHIILI